MRLYTDNQVTLETVGYLRRRHSVQSARVLFPDREDQFQFGYAKAHKRILVTLDHDFLQRRYTTNRHPGVIVVDTKHDDQPQMVNALLDRAFARFPAAADFYEAKVIISATGWRRVTREGATAGRWETPLVVREPEFAYAAAPVPA